MSYDKKMITLRSSDGEMFEVEEAVALESQTIKHMVEVDEGVNNVIIPLPNVTSHILAKVIEYCKKHVEAGTNGDKLKKHSLLGWDALFMNSVDQNVLYELILAAKYLNIKSLLDVTRQTVADMIKGKTPEHIRNTFDIKLTSLLRKKQIFFGGTNGDLSDIVIVEILI